MCAAGPDLKYMVDTSYEYYINNWYLEMDLKCMPAAKSALMITAYFVGFAINGLFFTIPDQIGRKKSLLVVMLISCIA